MIRLFRVFVPAGTVTMLVSELLGLTAAFVLATFVALPTDPQLFLIYDNGWARVLLVVASAVVALHLHDLYTNLYVKSQVILLQQLCVVAGIIFLIQGLVSYVSPEMRMPIHVMVPGMVLAISMMFLWRIIFSAYVLQVVGRERILLVGETPLLEEIGRFVETHPEAGSEVTGYVRDGDPRGTQLAGGTILGGCAELHEVVEATQPSRIVVGVPEQAGSLPVAELLELRFNGQIVEEAASAYERVAGRVSLQALRPAQLIYSGEYRPHSQGLFYQTVMNRTLSFIGIVVSLPITVAAAVAVKASSRGPILNRQVRVGLDGRLFTLYKFRCMRSPDGEADIWAPKEDPRVTAVGRFLRTIRADELPQLFNVLRGDMSIIGPRAERPDLVERLAEMIPCYLQRHSVRPGITGWAQINRKEVGLLDAIAGLEFDMYYIKNISASLDAFILAHTLKAIVVSRGED